MKNILLPCLFFLLAFGSLFSSLYAQENNSSNWLQFRGNERSGISAETGITKDWSVKAPQLLWKTEIGSGFSEIVLLNNKIYTMESDSIDPQTGSEYISAYEMETGKLIWKTKVDSIFIDIDGWGNGPRSTPVIDNNTAFCLSSFGKFTAVSINDGKILWQKNFLTEYESTTPRWGFSTSPLVFGENVVIEVGGTNSRTLAAFNKNSGELVWAKANGAADYGSPILAEINGQKQIIYANGKTLYSFNDKGDTLWTFKMPIQRAPTAAPIFIAPDKIFVSTLGTVGFVILKVENNRPKEILQGTNIKNDFSSSCYYNGHIYGFNTAVLQCNSAETGATLWVKRGYGKGSLILVDGQLIVLSDQGKLIFVEATPEKYNEIGNIQAIDGKSWTAPSFGNGKVFVRNLTQMACYKLK